MYRTAWIPARPVPSRLARMVAESEFSPEQWRVARNAAVAMLALAVAPENLAAFIGLGALVILFHRWKEELHPFQAFVVGAMVVGEFAGSIREGGLMALQNSNLWFPCVAVLRLVMAHR